MPSEYSGARSKKHRDTKVISAHSIQGDERGHEEAALGPLLCWAVVFADIGTSVYYVPGILYGKVGNLAGFFVFLTMSVFVLLTLKYAEVTYRFPQGGGVVTVAASALNQWFGALGGMFILVDYFLTAAISSLSGMQYLSVVVPLLGASIALPLVGSIQITLLLLTIGILVLLGVLNWLGVSSSARVSLVAALVAFVSDVAVLITVFIHLSFASFLSLFPAMFAHQTLTPIKLLSGFAGSFLAFSGLESISQLAPVMKSPRRRVANMALFLVVITVGITSPFLTMFSTLLQPRAAADPFLSGQLISLLAGHWGNLFLQTEIAISASALLVFASNTAIIGTYHVFLALTRLKFFPGFILKRNKLRGTPHYAIMLATGIPVLILLLVLGNISILGDMYAFGLLGAFTLTCLGMDIIRTRDRRVARSWRLRRARKAAQVPAAGAEHKPHHPPRFNFLRTFWPTLVYWLGILTTVLIVIAWSTNLVTKPLATAFGGTITIIGMLIAYFYSRRQEQQGLAHLPVQHASSVSVMPETLLAVLLPGQDEQNNRTIQAAVESQDGKSLAFLYVGEPKPALALCLFEYYDPYLFDEAAQQTFRQAKNLVRNVRVASHYLYRPTQRPSEVQEVQIVKEICQTLRPDEVLIAAEDTSILQDIHLDSIEYELTSSGNIAHFVAKKRVV